MKHSLILIIAMLLLATFLFAENPIAVMVNMKGDVILTRNAKKMPIKVGDILYNQDKIQSGNASFAALKYVDNGAYLKIFPNSIVSIKIDAQKGISDKTAKIEKGTLFSSINSKIKGNYAVESPTTVASVKGTKYISDLAKDRTFYVYTTEGTVEVENLKSHSKMSVSEGNKLESKTNGSMVVSKFKELPNSWSSMLSDTGESQKVKIELQNSYGIKKYIIIETE